MAIKYYKKFEPKNHPVLSNGTRIQFTTLDHLQGYYATDSDFVQNELARLMIEGRSGVSEISAKEFTEEYIEKKISAGQLRNPWREEITGNKLTGSGPMQTLGAEAVAAAVGIKEDGPAKVPVTGTDEAPKTEVPAKPKFSPPVGRRVPRVIAPKPPTP